MRRNAWKRSAEDGRWTRVRGVARVVWSVCAVVLMVSGAVGQGVAGGEGAGSDRSGRAGGGAGGVPAARQADNVAVITVNRGIDGVMAQSVRRRMQEAADAGAQAIVIELDTPGGQVGAVFEITETVRNSPVSNTVAWVHDMALSGGCITALACEEIVVSEDAVFGDSLVIQAPMGFLMEMQPAEREKMESALAAEVVHSARQNGYDEMLVQGFVRLGVKLWLVEHEETGERYFVTRDEYRLAVGEEPSETGAAVRSASDLGGVKEVDPVETVREIDESGWYEGEARSQRPDFSSQLHKGRYGLVTFVTDGSTVLTLKKDELVRFGLATAVVNDEQALRAYFGAKRVEYLHESWSERMVVFLTSMPVRGVLIVLFLLGMFIEMANPGMLFPGLVAAVSIATLLVSSHLNNAAGWWEVAAVVIGLMLMFVEVFVLPGFGVFGLGGLVLLMLGLFGAMVGDGPAMFGQDGGGGGGLYSAATLGLSVVVAGGVLWYLGRNMESLPVMGRLVLTGSVADDTRAEAGTLAARAQEEEGRVAVGAVGVAVTALRPGGKVEIDGQVHEARADGGYVKAGGRVKVVSSGAFGVVVEGEAVL